MSRIVLFCLFLGLLGCAGMDVASQNVEACKADPVCVEQMALAGSSAGGFVRAVGSQSPLVEVLALIVSNAVAFGVGVFRGRRKKG